MNYLKSYNKIHYKLQNNQIKITWKSYIQKNNQMQRFQNFKKKNNNLTRKLNK